MRQAYIARKTRETDIKLKLDIDGGDYRINTNCGFLNHMLELFACHAGFGLEVDCIGDVGVDFHHTVEDVGIALGQAFAEAIGEKRGIARYGQAIIPMDEALVLCAIDISGRGTLNYDVEIASAKVTDDSDKVMKKRVGLFDTELIEEFFTSFAREAKITLHLVKLYGRNTHHIIECCFKAFARALSAAARIDGDRVPSSKGVL